MKYPYLLCLGLTLGLGGCTSQEDAGKIPPTNPNPLLAAYNTPFEVPPFDQIRPGHYQPAFEEGFARHNAEISQIIGQPEAPSFDNTIVALDRAGQLLEKVSNVFFPLSSAHTNDSLRAVDEAIAPMLSAHFDNIRLNDSLFVRVQQVWIQKDKLNLDTEQSQLLEKTYLSFVRNGAKLDAKSKARLKEINSRLSVLDVKFSQNALDETNAYQLVIEQEQDLAGLPASAIQAAAEKAKAKGLEGKWVFGLQNASIMPFLKYADNRELRQKIWEAYKNRGNQGNDKDNNALIKETVALRAERAALLGYPNHAAFVLEERMAKTTDNVYDLLNKLWTPALEAARREEAAFQAMINSQKDKFVLQAYDWRYYEEKVRKEKYQLDAQEVMPYFSLNGVRDGIFEVCNKLYGLRFKALTDVPVYHPEVTAYEVTEADGRHVGVLYMDMHPRESKRGGAWMTSFRPQSITEGQRKAPVVSIVCNFSPPAGDTPSLLTPDEVRTFFHEFGHALHGLLSNVRYNSLAGTSVPTDFVELPSQIMENWATEPAVMRMYAKHYKTGEIIPDALIQKMEAVNTFGQGFATVEYLASSFLDLSYHTRNGSFEGSAEAFEHAAMQKLRLPASILPRHRSTYFSHIFAGGYSAGYYSYIWSGVLDTDAFQAFKTTSLFNPEKALSFRQNILEKGGSDDPMAMYVRFRGAAPTIDALLQKRGLSTVPSVKNTR